VDKGGEGGVTRGPRKRSGALASSAFWERSASCTNDYCLVERGGIRRSTSGTLRKEGNVYFLISMKRLERPAVAEEEKKGKSLLMICTLKETKSTFDHTGGGGKEAVEQHLVGGGGERKKG